MKSNTSRENYSLFLSRSDDDNQNEAYHVYKAYCLRSNNKQNEEMEKEILNHSWGCALVKMATQVQFVKVRKCKTKMGSKIANQHTLMHAFLATNLIPAIWL